MPDNADIAIMVGDYHGTVTSSCLAKTRPIHESLPFRILVPLEIKRHWEVIRDEVPWHQKSPTLVWRGATTGYGLRRDFVHALCSDHDVHFSRVVQHQESWIDGHPCALKPGNIKPQEMLRHKYQLSLEGNDKASDLQWKLASNAIVVMPDPTVESWLFEGRLLPFVHYVPLNRPSDINRTLNWMRSHDKECQLIVKNANSFFANRADRSKWHEDLRIILRRASTERRMERRARVQRA
jgi:hypothetical protein